jgi:hypothetical protein
MSGRTNQRRPPGRFRAAGRTISAAIAVLGGGGPLFGQLVFTNEAPAAGVEELHYGRGAAMFDLDGDGRLDLVAANAGMPNSFFRQTADHRFAKMGQAWGIPPGDASTWGVLVADFDNDGDGDVYFVNGGFESPQANRILRNDLDVSGVFTDVSGSAGAAAAVGKDFGATALDFDRDGRLDIFISTTDLDDPCRLLRNQGDLVFADVSEAAGIVHEGHFRHCSAGDVDNDGWADIAVGNQSGPNRLYRNLANGTFEDVAPAAGVDSPTKNFGMVLEDFDNDGWDDVYLPKYHIKPIGPSRLYVNPGRFPLIDVTESSGMTGQADMGHNTGDLDGDGYPEIYVGTGSPGFLMDDVLLKVVPAGPLGLSVIDLSASSGITSMGPTRCHGMAIGDYDGDGLVDVYVNNGGPEGDPAMLQKTFLWRNDAPARAWFALHLVGVTSNGTAVGARCRVVTSSGRVIRRVVRVGSGFANTNSPRLHFGLDDGETVEDVEIAWPSGLVQAVPPPPRGAVTAVIEAAPSCPADLDGSGTVGFEDLLTVLAEWGPCDPCDADLDGSGAVGFADLLLLLATWGPCS